MSNQFHYFKGCQTVDEAKQLYKRLAMQYHPDRNSNPNSTKIMQEINAEYERFIKSAPTDKNEKRENPKEYINIIDELMKMDGIEIEICWRWIWLHGNTYQHRSKLKEMGFQWSKGKKAWYFNPNKEEWKPRRSESWEKTRSRYGSQFVKHTPKDHPLRLATM